MADAEKLYDWYCSTRKWYHELAASEIARFERAALIASGASLAVASTLFQSGTPASYVALAWLTIGVGLIGASFFLLLLSNYLAFKDNINRLKELDENWEDGNHQYPEVTGLSKVVERLNFGAMAALGLGFIFVAASGVISAVDRMEASDGTAGR
jgi:hypothetical protein